MKAIIYAGISLLSVAAVYGLADYYGSQKSGTLDKLYTEEEIPATSKTNEATTTVIPVKNIEAVSETKKKRTSSKKIKAEDFSRGRIEEEVPVIKEAPAKNEEEVPVKIIAIGTKPVIVNKEPERELSLEKFSRAPLKAPRTKVKKIKS